MIFFFLHKSYVKETWVKNFLYNTHMIIKQIMERISEALYRN